MTKLYLLFLLLVGLLFLVACQEATNRNPNQFPDPIRFAKEISHIKKIKFSMDKERIVFTGSSSIRMWKDISARYPEYQIINTGFGGSEMSDLFYHLEHAVLKFAPAKVFIYEGDNDVNSAMSISRIMEQTKKVVEVIESQFPNCQIILISVKPSPIRWHLRPIYEKLNQEFESFASNKLNRKYVNVWDAMLDNHGEVDLSLFIEDGLHMNKAGYDIWADIIRPFVES